MRKDPAQEFAERVAEKWTKQRTWSQNRWDPDLTTLIASELRAGGWEQKEPQKVERSSWNQYSCRYHIGKNE